MLLASARTIAPKLVGRSWDGVLLEGSLRGRQNPGCTFHSIARALSSRLSSPIKQFLPAKLTHHIPPSCHFTEFHSYSLLLIPELEFFGQESTRNRILEFRIKERYSIHCCSACSRPLGMYDSVFSFAFVGSAFCWFLFRICSCSGLPLDINPKIEFSGRLCKFYSLEPHAQGSCSVTRTDSNPEPRLPSLTRTRPFLQNSGLQRNLHVLAAL